MTSERVGEPQVRLEKAIWTDTDFDTMGWHDARVYVISVQEYEDDTLPPTRVVLDLDYIVSWVEPQQPAKHFTFWVAPATLVFEKAWDIKGTLGCELEVADLHKLPSPDQYPDPMWHIEGHGFDLRLRAPGFIQFFRAQPIHTRTQTLTKLQRGGVSLTEQPFA